MVARASIVIPAELARLADVRQFVRDALAPAEPDRESVADLVQAVDEIVTNVIVHGYAGIDGAIELEIEVGDGTAVVAIRDGCPPFDPTAVPTPDTDAPLSGRRLGGMGVHFSRVLTDGITHRILPSGGNEVTLVKTFGTDRGDGTDADHD
jgi:serine/threonine-protein kinase RsbW